MNILFWSSVIFSLALCAHVIIWKIRIPRSQTKALSQIFSITLILCLFSLKFIKVFILSADNFLPISFSDYLHISLFFISLALAYLVTYSALEVDGPSFFILMNIDNAGAEGLDKNKLEQFITDEYLVIPRVNDLVRDNMVYAQANKYRLTDSGLMLARLFIFYRKLLGVQQKGG